MTGLPSTKLLAAKLWERTSAAGNRYFAGRLGGVKLLILENRERDGEDDPFFVDGEKQPKQAETARAPAPSARRRAAYPPSRSNELPGTPTRPNSVAMPNDELADLWPEPGP